MRPLRDRQALTIQPRKCQSEEIMTRILSKLIRIQLCAKSFILQVYDVLVRRTHNFDDKVTDMTSLPDNFAARAYYQPTDQGFEQRLCARLDEIRKLKSKSVSES
jgi:hypothetical protein